VPVPDKGFAGGLRLEHPAGGWTAWNPNGRNYRKMGEDCIAIRVGKKAAGCLLDGREWKEFPEP
ncbi:MAG: hypothetical protein GTO63_34460, partial [Anaerolineae bacterium]|nr:hypothetical protein [Anaerolineae bacterium]NIN99758.1 hypothetical protein [Anaerolineae bacterium]NIQ82588.1 hypothetical protein [Anaerolineae bacterium]